MAEYMNKIICGDCLNVMKGMPDDCVDLVFGSPPYEDARTYGIEFKLKGQEWVDWLVSVYMESLRICKGLVAFVVEGKTKKFRWSATPALLMADLHRAGVHLRKPPAFHRVGIPGSGGPDWLRNDYEFIVCATSGGKLPWSDNKACGKPCKYGVGGEMSYRNFDGSRKNQRHRKHTKRKKDGSMEVQYYKPPKKKTPSQSQRQNGAKGNPGYDPPALANPGNVIHLPVGGGAMGSDLAHENEAPFPEKLAEFFIKSFCPPDGITLDPFIGSGTTAAAAYKLDRKFTGIDVRQSQVDLSNKRLAESKLSLFEK